MLVALVLVMLLNLATQSHNNMPPAQPTGDYLKWCHATYGPTLYPQQLQNNLFFTLEDASALAAFAKQNELGLVAFWAINRDQPGSGNLGLYSQAQDTVFAFHDALKGVSQ